MQSWNDIRGGKVLPLSDGYPKEAGHGESQKQNQQWCMVYR